LQSKFANEGRIVLVNHIRNQQNLTHKGKLAENLKTLLGAETAATMHPATLTLYLNHACKDSSRFGKFVLDGDAGCQQASQTKLGSRFASDQTLREMLPGEVIIKPTDMSNGDGVQAFYAGIGVFHSFP